MAKTDVDLLLINPGNRLQIYQSLGSELTAVEPPVWAGLMASFMQTKGFRVEIIDANAENLLPDDVAKRANEINPVLTAVVVYGHQPSASTQIMPSASAICSALKEKAPHLKTILLGGHVSALPERSLLDEKVDFVANGEGLYTLLDLVQALKQQDPSYKDVRGLYFRENGQISFGAPAPLLKDLDNEMPGVTWGKFPMNLYRAHNWHCFGGRDRKPYAAIYTTLGCPFHCSFCCIQAPFKSGEQQSGLREEVNSYRFWSPDSVIKQIDTLVNDYGVSNIKIADEMFVLSARHVLGICDKIIERGHKLNIWAYTRVDTVKDNMLEKLKKAGVNWLAIGIEAANARVRDDVQKGFDQEDIVKTIEKIKAAGINIIGNYIFGLPEDNLASMQETLDMAMELNCEFANFYSTMAYPGSQLYNLATKEGWELPKTWSGYSQHAKETMPLRTKYLPSSEVVRFRDQAFIAYFKNPKYREMVRQKFGPSTVDEIDRMLSFKLVRENAAAR